MLEPLLALNVTITTPRCPLPVCPKGRLCHCPMRMSSHRQASRRQCNGWRRTTGRRDVERIGAQDLVKCSTSRSRWGRRRRNQHGGGRDACPGRNFAVTEQEYCTPLVIDNTASGELAPVAVRVVGPEAVQVAV